MSDRPEKTKKLSFLTERYINPTNDPRIYWAREVTFDYTTQAKRVDYMKFKPVNNTVSGIEKGDVFCFEVKSSVPDFHSPNGHNFIGDYNYYVMPKEVYEVVKGEIPYHVGVLAPNTESWQETPEQATLESIKPGRRYNRTRPIAEMLLMMFRSAARDRYRMPTQI